MNLNALLTDHGMSLELVIWSMFVGVCLAALIIMYNKNVLGPFVNALINAGASSPDSAKSFAELEIKVNPFVRLSLKNSGSFRKLILSADWTNDTASVENVDKSSGKSRKAAPLDDMRFYIPAENLPHAQSVYLNGGASLPVILLTVVGFLAAALLMFKAIPALIQMIKNLVEYISVTSK